MEDRCKSLLREEKESERSRNEQMIQITDIRGDKKEVVYRRRLVIFFMTERTLEHKLLATSRVFWNSKIPYS